MFPSKIKAVGLLVFFICLSSILSAQSTLYRRQELPAEERMLNLLTQLTLKEKISLLGFANPPIERLDMPAYNWWNEALHGVARNGEATVFPQAIALAATFNNELVEKVADAISTEARAKYNLAVRLNRREQYMGLTFWTPNINIFRDPRWGRGQETYGEDPFLTSTMGTAFVKGLQGNDPNRLKTAACAKHFAVHSGPEAERDSFNAVINEKDLRETYLYAFKKLVDNNVASVMCAYNRVNGQPCCTSDALLHNILLKEWGFKGQVVTDCGALDDVLDRHKAYKTKEETVAAAIKAGVNLECGGMLQQDVLKALEQGLLNEQDINNALSRSLLTQIKLGFYDDKEKNPYYKYGADSIRNKAHIALSRKAAEQSMVLLKNDGVLPLQKDKYASILVTGSNAASMDAIMGNYHGIASDMVTFAEGISGAAGPATAVQYDQGCDFTDTVHFGGIWASQNADLTIAVVGLTPLLEGEAGDAFLSTSTGDKNSLSLPASQLAFLKKLRAAHNKPIIVVVTAGSDVDINAIAPYADAVILAWYPGEQAGNALADLLYGKECPSGRLPVTFYQSLNDLPAYRNYDMQGRTYRYFQGKVQYPFGFGLSYTSFTYKWLKQPADKYMLQDTIRCAIDVTNTGDYSGDEVVQAYITYPSIERMPVKELKAFKRISIAKGKSKRVELNIPISELQKWDEALHAFKLYKGNYTINISKNADEPVLVKTITVE
ncbi:glycoside hydrolase family 3 N-terminal domain-containing protein [Chitinophagaceae bacterium LWZ2-11]